MKTFYEIIYLSSNTPWSGQDTDPESFSVVEESVKQAIQMAHSMIWNSYEFPFKTKKDTITALATVKAYEKPTGQLINLWLSGGTLYLANTTDFDFLDNTLGEPKQWYINEDNQLCLYPIPDKDYDVNVKYQTLMMARDSNGNPKYNLELENDVLNIPQELEDLYLQCLTSLSVVNFLQDNTDENYAPYQLVYEKNYQNLLREVRGSSGITTIKI